MLAVLCYINRKVGLILSLDCGQDCRGGGYGLELHSVF